MKTIPRAFGLVLALALLGGLGQGTPAAASQRVLLDGREVHLRQPLLQAGDVLMIWVRDAERVGLGALGRGAAGEVTLTKGNVVIAFEKDSQQARVNGVPQTMPAPATISEGRLMVPVEFVCQAFGAALRVGRVGIVQAPGRGAATRRLGTIAGRVTYGGAPAAGIWVRLVRASDHTFVRDAVAVTGPDGRYLFVQVPSGDYRAFVYVGDNPEFFNRRAPAVHVTVPQRAQAEEIRLGRILRPVQPSPGAEVRARLGHVRLAWKPCPRAAAYRVTVSRQTDGTGLFSTTSLSPYSSVPADRLEAGETLVWTVVATDTAGEFLGGSPGAGGEAWTFTLAPA